MKVKDYVLVGDKYQTIEATQKFIFQNESQLAVIISNLAGTSEEELTVTIEKIREEDRDE
jgi:hypothetical protein